MRIDEAQQIVLRWRCGEWLVHLMGQRGNYLAGYIFPELLARFGQTPLLAVNGKVGSLARAKAKRVNRLINVLGSDTAYTKHPQR
jgi:hypothetical protein